jgi:hypothetical protein
MRAISGGKGEWGLEGVRGVRSVRGISEGRGSGVGGEWGGDERDKRVR